MGDFGFKASETLLGIETMQELQTLASVEDWEIQSL